MIAFVGRHGEEDSWVVWQCFARHGSPTDTQLAGTCSLHRPGCFISIAVRRASAYQHQRDLPSQLLWYGSREWLNRFNNVHQRFISFWPQHGLHQAWYIVISFRLFIYFQTHLLFVLHLSALPHYLFSYSTRGCNWFSLEGTIALGNVWPFSPLELIWIVKDIKEIKFDNWS